MKVWVLFITIAAALAGCSDAPAPVEEDDGFSEELDQELQATDETGVIRGVVVDPAIVPIADVTIELTGVGRTTMTNAKGEFGFADLDPGTYFVEARKVGYFPAQASVEVKAGVDNPPVAKVLLERDITYNPYYGTIYHKGHYQCGTSVVVVCAAPSIILDIFFGMDDPLGMDTSTETFFFDLAPTFIQTEMAWESTQTLTPELFLQREALDPGCDGRILVDETEGPSPIRLGANQTTLEATDVGGEDCGIYHSIFSGGSVGVSLEQPFEWFITEFYGYEPPADWWFIYDGAAPPPGS